MAENVKIYKVERRFCLIFRVRKSIAEQGYMSAHFRCFGVIGGVIKHQKLPFSPFLKAHGDLNQKNPTNC